MVIKAIKKMGVSHVRFTGGEPLLRKDLFSLIEYARRLRLKVWLNTNGSLITKANAPKIKRFVENVLISLNGFDEASEFAVSKGSFKKKMEGVDLLKGIGFLRAGIVLTTTNIQNLERYYQLARKFDEIEFYRPIGFEVSKKLLKNAIVKIVDLNRKYERSFRIANPLPFCFFKPELLSIV